MFDFKPSRPFLKCKYSIKKDHQSISLLEKFRVLASNVQYYGIPTKIRHYQDQPPLRCKLSRIGPQLSQNSYFKIKIGISDQMCVLLSMIPSHADECRCSKVKGDSEMVNSDLWSRAHGSSSWLNRVLFYNYIEINKLLIKELVYRGLYGHTFCFWFTSSPLNAKLVNANKNQEA